MGSPGACNRYSSSDIGLNISRSDSGGGYWSIPSGSWRVWRHGAGTNFWGNWNRYSVTATVQGSWGDIQVGGLEYWN